MKRTTRRCNIPLDEISPGDGVWIVYGYGVNAYPIIAFAKEDEIKALQYRDDLRYGQVKFWEFETEWSN